VAPAAPAPVGQWGSEGGGEERDATAVCFFGVGRRCALPQPWRCVPQRGGPRRRRGRPRPPPRRRGACARGTHARPIPSSAAPSTGTRGAAGAGLSTAHGGAGARGRRGNRRVGGPGLPSFFRPGMTPHHRGLQTRRSQAATHSRHGTNGPFSHPCRPFRQSEDRKLPATGPTWAPISRARDCAGRLQNDLGPCSIFTVSCLTAVRICSVPLQFAALVFGALLGLARGPGSPSCSFSDQPLRCDGGFVAPLWSAVLTTVDPGRGRGAVDRENASSCVPRACLYAHRLLLRAQDGWPRPRCRCRPTLPLVGIACRRAPRRRRRRPLRPCPCTPLRTLLRPPAAPLTFVQSPFRVSTPALRSRRWLPFVARRSPCGTPAHAFAPPRRTFQRPPAASSEVGASPRPVSAPSFRAAVGCSSLS